MGEVVHSELNSPKKDIWFPKGCLTVANDGPSLISMQRVVLDMKEKVDVMLRWVVMGLCLSKGCE